ncbi:MAG: disulfide bond formation protein B [Burkholderiales bacterium]|nr:disulfide bond formation protein B [Burkholderiales bacterium]
MKFAYSGRALYTGVAVVALGAVGAALVTQHVLGMQPCPWCVLQRLIFVAMALVALPGLVVRQRSVQLASTVAVVALALAGVATALWQHFVAARSASCAMTLADQIMQWTGLGELLPQVFAAYASCADAASTLLGLPYEFYSLTLFIVLGGAALLHRRA